MATQQREWPPPYGKGERSLEDRSVAFPDIPKLPLPTLEPLPMVTFPTLKRGAEDARGPQGIPNVFQAPIANALQHLQLPAVPQQDPGQRTSPPTETGSVRSVDTKRSASMEDPDDRMAAEALCGLGKVDSARPVPRPAPSGYDTPLKYYPIDIEHTRSAAPNGDAEPLLSLLTSSHPWLGGTINGSLSAYSSTKSHSPRFIQAGADFVERTIGTPVASTVGTVSRKTGVEGGLRRYLDSCRPSELDRIDPSITGQDSGNKRRRISSDLDEDIQMGYSPQRTLTGRASVDTLPVYDDNRSPAYEDSDSSQLSRRHRRNMSRSWSTQLMISSSGLGAALSEASLRSLKFVLSILRNANTHVMNLMAALKLILQEYDTGVIRLEEGQILSEKMDPMHLEIQPTQPPGTLIERIKQLNAEIWNTVKGVVNAVSRYTGGALPENASAIVRWQLMSVPQRWQRAVSSRPSGAGIGGSAGGSSEKEALTSAHRMLAFSLEGLDMIEQVSGVVDSTIVSAEKWLSSLGMKNKQSGGHSPAVTQNVTAAAAAVAAAVAVAADGEQGGGAGQPQQLDVHMPDLMDAAAVVQSQL